MAFTLRKLHEIAKTALKREPAGLPVAALMAAIAMEESGGDTKIQSKIVDPETGEREPSYGLLQVNVPAWPKIGAETRALIRRTMPDYSRAVAQFRIASPIFRDAGSQAKKAVEILEERGFPAGPIELMLLIDAAWQGPGVVSWARETTTGNVEDIRAGTKHHNPERRRRVRRRLSELGVTNSPMVGAAALLGFLGLGGLMAAILWALGEWVDEA